MLGTTKPKVIGIYGVSGCGKSTLMAKLELQFDGQPFLFREGREAISKFHDPTLNVYGRDEFDALSETPESKKIRIREQAIRSIGSECEASGKVGVVAGHAMLWERGWQTSPLPICTPADMEVYTHIIYLHKSATTLHQQRTNDKKEDRKELSVDELERWQREEMELLKDSCVRNGVLYTVVRDNDVEMRVCRLLKDFREHDEAVNLDRVFQHLDKYVASLKGLVPDGKEVQTVMVFDADGTIDPHDTGKLFWKEVNPDGPDPVKAMFQQVDYSYTSFRQASLMYTEVNHFDEISRLVGNHLKQDLEIEELLRRANKSKSAVAIIVTSGLKKTWELKGRYAEDVPMPEVFGASQPELFGQEGGVKGYVVTPDIKAAIVARLQEKHGMYVWAFGDSKVDLPMLRQANQAVVVTREATVRSNAMDVALQDAVNNQPFAATQWLIGSATSPREDITGFLPVVNNKCFTDAQAWKHPMFAAPSYRIEPILASNTAMQLLATPTRDAKTFSVALRNAHQRAGWHLAVEHLTRVIGLETYNIDLVQDGKTDNGHRLKNEDKTVIVPLMRGGEPMALGVSEAFPLATFVHAKDATDLKAKHIANHATVILVDWVINTGDSMVEFVRHIRQLNTTIRIVIVAGVVQEGALEKMGGLVRERLLSQKGSLVALRTSKTQYKGKGKTDTGHRLFNTTHMD